ncbi:MAG: radical SAM protein [Candidatus Omnitrophica bacterium]|nr:radical SAM protein [Candidatus Omnitrophota bacterium]
MISFTGLLGDISSYGDKLRYRRDLDASKRRPIAVWNCSRRCNLNCVHCYSDSKDKAYAGELTTDEAKAMITDLKAFNVPVLLFSGGEPLMREDLFELNAYARGLGLRTVISTNGTLITADVARKIKAAGFEYIGVSLDGIGRNNDRFRGKVGAYDEALNGIRNLVNVRQKVGLRFTITGQNYLEMPLLFDLVEKEAVDRICFYHLAYSGRGGDLKKNDLGHADTRRVLDDIYNWVTSFAARGVSKEVLTVDNHADGAYLYLKLRRTDPARAQEVYHWLRANGGNASGIGIANIDNLGDVHADQFWQNVSFGNVRARKFGDIWMDTSHELMGKLKDRQPFLKGRCPRCKFLDICNGNLRVRAWAASGDVWGDDPGCYLTDEEVFETPTPSFKSL